MSKYKPPIPIQQNWAKVTMFISAGKATISESHWMGGVQDLTAFPAGISQLVNLRAALLGSDATMPEVRVSLEGVFRDSLVLDTTLIVPPTANGPCDPRHRSVGVRLEGGSQQRKHLYLGLVPDAAVVRSIWAPDAVPGLLDAYNLYFNFLTGVKPWAQQFGFLTLGKDPANQPVVRILSTVNPFPGTLCTFNTVAPHKLSVGDIVRVSRCAVKAGSLPAFNGTYKVTQVANPTSFTVYLVGGSGTLKLISGSAHKLVRVYQAYTNWWGRGIGYHKRGGRAFLPLGKSRTKIAGGS